MINGCAGFKHYYYKIQRSVLKMLFVTKQVDAKLRYFEVINWKSLYVTKSLIRVLDPESEKSFFGIPFDNTDFGSKHEINIIVYRFYRQVFNPLLIISGM
jgi:hypothetical protein